MPPYVARKRSREASPADDHAPPAKRPTKTPPSKKKQLTLFDAADENPKRGRSLEDNKKYLKELEADDDEDDEELSDVDSDDFEDALAASSSKARRAADDQEDEDEMDWEDAIPDSAVSDEAQPTVSGDLELTLNRFPTHTIQSLSAEAGAKKGPSKIERSIRVSTHCLHVQALLAHNLRRNHWANDKAVQQAVMRHVTPGLMKEVERWRVATGKSSKEDDTTPAKGMPTKSSDKKGKGKAKGAQSSKTKNQRDWGTKADHIEQDTSSASRLDPTLRLIKILIPFWKKRFQVTAPGLRKIGYKEVARLEQDMNSFRHDPHRAEGHGERVQGLAGFRKLAEKCQGSRDVGAQLFSALLRAIGIETRLVANMQPIGFGWSKNEEAHLPKQARKTTDALTLSDSNSEGEEVTDDSATSAKKTTTTPKRSKKRGPSKTVKPGGDKDAPIDLSDSDSDLSTPPVSDAVEEDQDAAGSDNDSDASLIDTTPALPKKFSKRHDRDLPYPHYWCEVLIPTTSTYLAVDPLVLNLVATNADKLALFEPRGAKADKAKQVLAYIVAFSADSTAKDVTVRYLKRHVWPGKTKGVRLPLEKVPVYNKRGKVMRYEDYDWFARVMRVLARPRHKLNPADKLEDTTDLLPIRVVREPKAGGEETLQGYKNSAEFVLERYLRREEALLPSASAVRHFTSGKGEKAKTDPVYKRTDVVACKTIESWHKEGRAVKAPELSRPLKHVPMRAVTLQRKREIEENERETGEKMKQALYSRAQTEWIIPPPIVGGVIPRNAFGNMDVYVPTMVPKGAVHVRLRGTAKLCKRLGIEFAEACTGFEFGNKRAVPVLTGVVVAKENEGMLRDAWRTEEEEKRKKEKAKREKIALTLWKKFLLGLRLMERFRRDYGDGEEAEEKIQAAVHAETAKKGKGGAGGGKKRKAKTGVNKDDAIDLEERDNDVPSYHDDEVGGGGFMNSDNEGNGVGGGFLLDGEDVEFHDPVAREGFALDNDPASRITHLTTTGNTGDDHDEEVEDDGMLENGHAEDENPEYDQPYSEHNDDDDENVNSNATPAEDQSSKSKHTPRAKITPARKRGRPSILSTTTGPNHADTIADTLPTPPPTSTPAPTRSKKPRSSSVKPTPQPTQRRKSGKHDDDDDNDTNTSAGDGAAGGNAGKKSTPRRRNAGRKSKEGARSRYFVGASDVEDDGLVEREGR